MPTRGARRGHPDLLTRPPREHHELDRAWGLVSSDPVAQLRVLADLLAAGLLTQEEFDRQKAKVLDDA